MIENYFYLKQGSDYVTATEFVSAPIFKFIDPSISRNYVFSQLTVIEYFASSKFMSVNVLHYKKIQISFVMN